MKGETVTVGIVGGQKSEEKITKGAATSFIRDSRTSSSRRD